MKICVLPEIGSRIFSAVDKTNNYDFFYRQHVIKPALIGYAQIDPKGSPFPEAVKPPARPEEIETVNELYHTGLRLEQFYNPALEPYPYYEEALKRDPDNHLVNTALAILYLKRGMFARAEEMLINALSQTTKNYTRPKDGEAHYYLGLALRAQEFNPEDARAPYYLGNLLFDLQPEEAIKQWEKSAALDANFALVQRNLGLGLARVKNDVPRAL